MGASNKPIKSYSSIKGDKFITVKKTRGISCCIKKEKKRERY
jgi:hypothetical protein